MQYITALIRINYACLFVSETGPCYKEQIALSLMILLPPINYSYPTDVDNNRKASHRSLLPVPHGPSAWTNSWTRGRTLPESTQDVFQGTEKINKVGTSFFFLYLSFSLCFSCSLSWSVSLSHRDGTGNWTQEVPSYAPHNPFLFYFKANSH